MTRHDIYATSCRSSWGWQVNWPVPGATINTEGPVWLQKRRHIQPFFQRQHIFRTLHTMHTDMLTMLDTWSTNQPMNLQHRLMELSFDCTLGPRENTPSAAYGCQIPFGNRTTTAWSVQTTDGKTGILSIDGNTYQLPREAIVIRVKADGGKKRTTAYQQTLPVFQNDPADRQLQQWLMQHPDLGIFATRFGVENSWTPYYESTEFKRQAARDH